ncbi:flagellar export protein FliJ [Hathewaya limosa]|uniref:Flagellar FliJ protein n=1 Tax=Hathewaya limosa TaxID=1536 RepID=A0ABU0JT61_HATLI|nr:flagellar export protein FliJ [Hathewaya limosa]MDQ0479259.1 flagellar FliJ protein [Hathewaya limosa]
MQGRFQFRLQKVLDIRMKEEDQSKMEFKKAMEEKRNTEIKLNNLKNSYDKFNKFDEEESIIERKLKLNYLKCLNSTINSVNEELKHKNKFVEEKRIVLKEKQVSRKTVEILKQKKLEEFQKEQNSIEQKANDEFALYGFIRARS